MNWKIKSFAVSPHAMKLQIQSLFLIILFSLPALSFQIFRTGSVTDYEVAPRPFYCLVGGGDDLPWSQGWKAFLNHSGGGDIVIIQAYPDPNHRQDWIYYDPDQVGFPKVNSVTTLALNSRSDSFEPAIVETIHQAEAIFVAGGDQSLYIDWIHETPLEKALYKAIYQRKVPLAGTSAGMAIMGEVDYAAHFGSPLDSEAMVTADDVLANPLADFVDLSAKLLQAPFLKNVITETHVGSRNRQGRLVGFLAKAIATKRFSIQTARGIGVDDHSAFCYNKNGVGKVFGPGLGYFLKAEQKIDFIQPNQPLIWKANENALLAYIIQGQNDQSDLGYFDLNSWVPQSSQFETEYWWIENKQLQRRSVSK